MKTFWLKSASTTPICQKEMETRITNTTKISCDQQLKRREITKNLVIVWKVLLASNKKDTC